MLMEGGGGSVLTASKIDSENSDGDGVDNSNDDEHAKVRSDRDYSHPWQSPQKKAELKDTHI